MRLTFIVLAGLSLAGTLVVSWYRVHRIFRFRRGDGPPVPRRMLITLAVVQLTFMVTFALSVVGLLLGLHG